MGSALQKRPWIPRPGVRMAVVYTNSFKLVGLLSYLYVSLLQACLQEAVTARLGGRQVHIASKYLDQTTS